MWQDYVISICIAVFIIALIPSIRGTNKPELSSCLTTAAVQLVLTTTYLTLNLWYSVGTGILLLGCWSTLAFQQWQKRKNTKVAFAVVDFKDDGTRKHFLKSLGYGD